MLDNEKVKFLAQELGVSVQSVEAGIDKSEFRRRALAICAQIIEDEVEKEENGDAGFVEKRLNAAEFTAAKLMDMLDNENE
ncbi:MAG: hypothetical protein LBE35_04225 [Clostridiales bacterium]|jgi:hypothetical protein|nr:hypothetical protein [Clostridiales bacterium]